MAVSKDFAKALDASKSSVKRFKEAKKAKPSAGGVLPNIESGQYIARIGISADKTKEGTPRVRIRSTIAEGEYLGKSWNTDFYLKDKDAKREQQNWDRLSQAIQVLYDVDEEDFDKWEMSDLIKAINEIDEENPYVRIGVQKKGKMKDGKPTDGFFLNTYFNELLSEDEVAEFEEDGEDDEEGEDEDGEESDEESDEDGEEEGDEDGEDEDEGDDDEEGEDGEDDDEEEAEEIAVGDFVWHKVKVGKKTKQIECQVKKLYKNGTADLNEVNGTNKYPKVAVDTLEIVTEEE